jgi:hypothetical protein
MSLISVAFQETIILNNVSYLTYCSKQLLIIIIAGTVLQEVNFQNLFCCLVNISYWLYLQSLLFSKWYDMTVYFVRIN